MHRPLVGFSQKSNKLQHYYMSFKVKNRKYLLILFLFICSEAILSQHCKRKNLLVFKPTSQTFIFIFKIQLQTRVQPGGGNRADTRVFSPVVIFFCFHLLISSLEFAFQTDTKLHRLIPSELS